MKLGDTYAYTGGKTFDPALPTVVFLHGALNDHSVWTLHARWFAHHGRGVLALDLPGHGRSGGAALDSMERLADWLWSTLDAAGVRRAALVGHSLGSLIALEAAGRQPDRASHLMMVATAFPMKVSDALLTTSQEQPRRAMDMVNTFSHAGFAAKPSYPGPGAWLHGGNRALMRRMQDNAAAENLFRLDFGVCDGYAAGLEAAARVTAPATLILGSRDQMTQPRQAATIGQALKATVLTVPAGHAMMSEAPDAVLAALRSALDR